MLGHSFARIGAETLASKPWLYFMQSGGVALAFIIPAVWLTHARNGRPARALIDAALAGGLSGDGTVFWALD